MHSKKSSLIFTAAGIAFAILWSSAATATKFGLQHAQPLVIAEMRFALASLIMLFMAHGVFKHRLPQKREWKQLAIYGLLNISIYLGLYVIAMQSITAGIGALAVASNPAIIGALSLVFLKQKLRLPVVLSLIICSLGVICAAWPLLGKATISEGGLALLLLSMLSYSAGALYFSSKQWSGLSLLTINAWQTLLGGLFLFPAVIYFYQPALNQYTTSLWISVAWLAIPVSVVAVQLWLWLLQIDTVRAGLWLFLCPLFGFMIAAWLLNDEISIFTIIGIILVIFGLLLARKKK